MNWSERTVGGVDFYRYKIFAIITGKDDTTVNMIFSRINSTGIKIS